MKEKLLLLLFFVVSCFSMQAGVEHLLPKPQQINVKSGEGVFSMQSVELDCGDLTDVFTDWIVDECGGTVNNGASQRITIQVGADVDNAEFQDEAYFLDVTSSQILIKSKTRNGAFWALQTLAQLANGTKGSVEIPSVEIVDWPAFRIRGYMHDTGRSYVSFEELKKEVKLLSRYKINVFHWHLTESQAWRLESKIYPVLNDAKNHTRHAGKYYTQEQAKEMQQLCKKYGMTLIPEIEMPGHSDCFTRTFGYSMQTTEGLAKVKELLLEACDVFDESPWMHIGTDEIAITMSNFIPEVTTLLRSKGKKVASWWNNESPQDKPDMVQLWGGATKTVPGVVNVDCRNQYLNHFDMFADVAGIYSSNILGVKKQTNDMAGFVAAVWNDRLLPKEQDIILENPFYASILAMGERGWIGGGDYYINQRGTVIPSPDTKEYKEFVDWERRFLYWKETHLKNEPIAYVKQTQAKWRITDAFPNGGTLDSAFAPEDSLVANYVVDGKKYGTQLLTGSGFYLRHFWGEVISPGVYKSPQANTTGYAYTWVYSPKKQTVGAWIETQNYGRADKDLPAPEGKWDYKDSRIWINDKAILPPVWESQRDQMNLETPLTNENFTARPPISVELNEGWNKVLLRLPIGALRADKVSLDRMKWMFAFAFVTLDGKKEIENITWSPDKNLNQLIDNLSMIVESAQLFRSQITVGDNLGEYPLESVIPFDKVLAEAKDVMKKTLSDEEATQIINKLSSEFDKLKKSKNSSALIISDENKQAYYKFTAPKRGGSPCISFQGAEQKLIGEPWVDGADKMMWKLVDMGDGSYGLVNKVDGCYLKPAIEKDVIATATKPEKGWSILPSAEAGLFVIVCGTIQLNQGGGGPLFNWGGGNNLTDPGCKFKIELVASFPENVTAPLKTSIANAMNTINAASIGTQPGNYSEKAHSTFTMAIEQSITVLQGNPNNDQMTAAILALNGATDTFKKSLIVPVGSDNKNYNWYSFCTPNRGNLYVTCKGSDADLKGENKASGSDFDAQLWKFLPLSDGSFSLVNKETGAYISPNSGISKPLQALSETQVDGGWKFTYTGVDKYFIISSGTVQFNQQNSPFAVLNWGSGTNTTDAGCQYIIKLEKAEDPTGIQPQKDNTNQNIWLESGVVKSVGITAAIDIYTISGLKINNNGPFPKGIYIARAGSYTQYLISK